MQFTNHSRIRTTFFCSLTLFLLLVSYVAGPWCYAAWIWRNSTIDYPITLLDSSAARIPRIIHQTWRDADTIPLSWQQASNSCRQHHPDYQYRFWTDQAARRLIESEFPCLLATYDSYPYDIQRADIIRLVILYVYGGIYLDLDIICLRSLDQLRAHTLVLPRTRPVGLSNDFIMAEPKDPFLLQAIHDLPTFHRQFLTKYVAFEMIRSCLIANVFFSHTDTPR